MIIITMMKIMLKIDNKKYDNNYNNKTMITNKALTGKKRKTILIYYIQTMKRLV